MSDNIRNYQEDESVAFAHTISANFGHTRQMTAGVAVTFGHHFGKPTTADCVSSHLGF